MNRPHCACCGLPVAGTPHQSPDDCLRHLAPRYQLAQKSLEHMHQRYRSLEDRLERLQIQLRTTKKDAKRYAAAARRAEQIKGTIPDRVEALEKMLSEALGGKVDRAA